MTVLKGVIQIFFSGFVIVFKHVQTTDIVLVGYHLTHGALLIQLSDFHRTYQILAKSQNVESKVHGKQLIDNVQDTGLFRPLCIERSTGLQK